MKQFLRMLRDHLSGKPRPKNKDVFLISYPKSGNTWVRFLIANLARHEGESQVDFHNVHAACPEWERWDGRRTPILGSTMVFKSHQPFNPDFRRVIYIVRDPRDMYISYHKYSLPTLEEAWDLAQFIDHFESRYGRWSTHVESWVSSNLAKGGDFLLVRYEDLLAEPHVWVRRMADFIGLDSSDAKVAEAVEQSAFDSMKRIEQEKGRKFATENKVASFVRKGQKGEWKDCFGEAEWQAFNRHESVELMKRVGYSDDAQ